MRRWLKLLLFVVLLPGGVAVGGWYLWKWWRNRGDPADEGDVADDGNSVPTDDIDDLNLIDPARSGAIALRQAIPSIKFTSGRRSRASQAAGMASHIINDRQWASKTYANADVRGQIQAVVDGLPAGATQQDIAAAITQELNTWPDAKLGLLSRHPAGLAFDLHMDPAIDTDDIQTALEQCDGFDKFLTSEAGQACWHVQWKPPPLTS
jgi:hypothetical protein